MKPNLLTNDYSTALSAHSEAPCLSLYQPTHRHHPGNQQDPLLFRSLVIQLEQSLGKKASQPNRYASTRQTVMKSNSNAFKGARQPKLARILVPTDFSCNAEQALSYALPLVRQFGGKITLVHVLDWPLIPGTISAAMTGEARITGDVKQELDTRGSSGVKDLLMGSTAEAVVRHAPCAVLTIGGVSPPKTRRTKRVISLARL